jgi:branched-chain amino acid transport system ATP-binding protein
MATQPAVAAAPARLAVDGLHVLFDGVVAVADVSFEVAPGEVVAVIGPNGSGKTTVLNAVNGVVHPTAGRVSLDGHDVTGRRPSTLARLGLARTFQSPGLFDQLDLVTNLLLGRHLQMRSGFLAGMIRLGRSGREERAQRRAVGPLVEQFGLEPFCGEPVGTLSYGTQKRIELARALATEPRLLLLDEPAAGCDADERITMEACIRRAVDSGQGAANGGLSVVLVEHDMATVDALADRVVVLDFGELITTGTFDEVRRDPRVVEAYLGASAR